MPTCVVSCIGHVQYFPVQIIVAGGFIIGVQKLRPDLSRFSPSGLSSTMGFSDREARLPALMVASFLYGLNLITFFIILQRLFGGTGGRRCSRGIHFPMTMVVILLFIASSVHLALQLALVMRGYVYFSQSRGDDFQMERRKFIISQVCSLTLFA